MNRSPTEMISHDIKGMIPDKKAGGTDLMEDFGANLVIYKNHFFCYNKNGGNHETNDDKQKIEFV
jgi:ribosomal protein L13